MNDWGVVMACIRAGVLWLHFSTISVDNFVGKVFSADAIPVPVRSQLDWLKFNQIPIIALKSNSYSDN